MYIVPQNPLYVKLQSPHKRKFAGHTIHMTIRELLSENRIEIGAPLYSKNEVLDELIRLQKISGAIHNPKALKRELCERERAGNTAVSCRIAIPDVAHSGSVRTAISAVTVKDGVDYGAPDKRPVRIIFLIAGKSGSSEHIRVRERLQQLLSDTTFSAQLCAAGSSREFLELIEERERLRFSLKKAPPLTGRLKSVHRSSY